MRMYLLPILFACVAAPLRAQNTKRCEETPIDFTNPASPIYHECHVHRKAKLRGTPPRVNFRPSSSAVTACYRADFEFVVDTIGAPEMSTVRRLASTDPVFANAVAATIVRLRYEPARIDTTPVRQVVRFTNGTSVMTRQVEISSGGGFMPPSDAHMPRPPEC